MKKKILYAFICVMIAMSFLSYRCENLTERYNVIERFTLILTVSSNVASCNTTVTTNKNYEIRAWQILQNNINGKWNSIKSWNTYNKSTKNLNLTNKYQIKSGKFRLFSKVEIFDKAGNLVESASKYSAIKIN